MVTKNRCFISDCMWEEMKKGFCERHYKWWRKGYCDAAGKMLQEPKTTRYALGDRCAIPWCQKPPTKKKMCASCYGKVRSGTLTRSGTLKTSPTYKYQEDWHCICCNKAGHGEYHLGFCNFCYINRYGKGFVDFYGKPTGKKLYRRLKYLDTDVCREESCQRKPRSNWFCQRHEPHFKKGSLTADGMWVRKSLARSF